MSEFLLLYEYYRLLEEERVKKLHQRYLETILIITGCVIAAGVFLVGVSMVI